MGGAGLSRILKSLAYRTDGRYSGKVGVSNH